MFPYLAWVSVISPNTHPDCRALDGNAWRVNDPNLLRVARRHFAQALTHCGCTGMALSEADAQRRGVKVMP